MIVIIITLVMIMMTSNSDNQQVRGQCTAVMIMSLMLIEKGLRAVWFPDDSIAVSFRVRQQDPNKYSILCRGAMSV